MESTELRQIWKQYEARLEKSWHLNIKMITDLNLNKSRSSIAWFAFFKGLIIVVALFLAHFQTMFIIDNFANITLTIPVYLLVITTYIAVLWSCHQLGLAFLINYTDPVVEIQKKIERLRTQKLRFNKFIFYISYPYVYLMGFTVLHLDISMFPIKWMIPNIILAVLWIPFCSWLIKKYNSPGPKSKFWQSLSRDSSLTPGSASRSLSRSLKFIREIEEFEQA